MASTVTNYAERQNDEIEVLRSMYAEDFVEEEPKIGAWNKTADRSFQIRLKATSGDEEKIALTLNVSFPPTYPKTFPRLKLTFDEDVHLSTRTQALGIIQDRPKDMAPGTELIAEFATLLQEVLDNAFQTIPRDVPTLDEERTTKEAALLKAQQEEQKRQSEATQVKDANGTEEERRLLQELVEQEKSRSAQRRLTRLSSAPDQSDLNQDVPGAVRFDQSSVVRDRDGKLVDVRMVFDKVFYRKSPIAKVSTVRVWLGAYKPETPRCDAPFLLLKECFVASTGPDDSVKKAIQSLETKLDQQTRGQKSHPNIIKPINYLILRSETQEDGSSLPGWTVSVLMELASKGSLSELLEVVGKLSDTKKIREWALQILGGLHHYHQNGSAHASVHLNNILLEQGEAKNILAKLSDGVYERELYRLREHTQKHPPLAWKAPEHTANQEDASAASDIWDFGICLLQMGLGKDVVEEYSSPTALLDEANLSDSFAALLRQLFNFDPKKRPSAWDALFAEFFRNDDTLFKHQHSGLSTQQPSTADFLSLTSHRARRESSTGVATSRYVKEFVEDGRLGRGGFGEVFRARNRIDGQLYAIKKVKARSRAALDPVLSEASVLSRLNHPNVVRYYASWIDDAIIIDNEDESGSSDEELSSSSSRFGQRPVLAPSSRGLDFISSNNAHVVFGNQMDDDVVFGNDHEPHNGELGSSSGEDGESEGDEGSSNGESTEDETGIMGPRSPGERRRHKDGLISPRNSSQRRPNRRYALSDRDPWTVLYIQMEYCRPETLRDLINTGIQADAVEGFRLLRQIVQGLAHIHAASIVHRDLKPENVFIDTNGDVRIGDFGLARPGESRAFDRSGTQKAEVLGSFTTDVGTPSYVAPEVLAAGGGKYDEKADMYSLGVIFLEMNVVFSTGMERAENLAFLQMERPLLPSVLESSEKATQASIIRSLTQRQPTLRPSSLDLLTNGLIPAQDEDETLRLARRLVADSTSHLRRELIGSLFPDQLSADQMHDTHGPERGPAQKLEILDDVSAMSRSLPDDLELQTIVKDRLASIFHRHGAVERTDSPALFPYHPCYPPSEVLRFVNPVGKVLQLPYDLVLPNAMLLARAVNTGLKRTFVFDNVYRTNAEKDRPIIYGEANFEIVSGEGSRNLAIHEAEAIKALDEVLDTFPHMASAHMCYHINHSQLLNFILKFCDIHQKKWSTAKETISKLNTSDWNWAKVRHELRAPPTSIPGTCLDELERFDFRDTLEKGIPRLRSILQNTAGLETYLDQMQIVVKYLARFGLKRKIYLSPLGSYNEKFYSGNILFQCVYDQRKRNVFAAGGRYDQLIRDHQPLTTRKNQVHAVGFQLTWTGLAMGLMTYLKAQAKLKTKKKLRETDRYAWISRRCEVLVDSFDQDLLKTIGIQILSEIWANEISAELAERDRDTSNEYIRTEEIKGGHGWVVLIKSEDIFKVKNTARKEETEVRPSELASHLRSEIRERDREEGRTTIAKVPLHRQVSQAEASGNVDDREHNVKFVIPLNKGKKSNRKTVVEEARSRAQEWRTASQEYPIIAIETKDQTFNALEKTNIHDADSWKTFIQEAPAGERSYLLDVQGTLQSLESPAAFIYNYRTKQMMHCYLNKT